MRKKSTLIYWAIFATLTILLVSERLLAQEPDTLDVPQGFETLNIAIESDTVAGGAAKNPNRVYRLERGGYYLLNGEIKGLSGITLRVVAAKGDGPMPILIPAADETGAAARAFRPGADAVWKGLYVSGIDNLGNTANTNMFRLEKKNGRYIVDGCYMDGDAQAFFRMNAEGQKLFIINSLARNSYLLADPNNGRFIDTRGNTQDTIFVQNSTFYTSSSDPLRSGDGIVKTFIMDHTTLYQTALNNGEFDVDRAVNCIFTNNLLIDFGAEGRTLGDSLSEVVIPIDTLKATALATDDQRVYTIKNNVMGWTPQVKAWLDSKDSLEAYTFLDQRGERFVKNFPNMVAENNIYEDVAFTDAPDPAQIIVYAEHRFQTNYSNEGNPDIRNDRNGVGPLTENPGSIGPAEDDFDFDYSTTTTAYTHAAGGFPAGDLNWFPVKKAEWEQQMSAVERDGIKRGVPVEFNLAQNYPNPFNPVTEISYQVKDLTEVSLIVYNLLGQKIRTLIDRKSHIAGSYSIQWDGRKDSGQLATSGVYFYKMVVGDQVKMRKMLLVK